MSKVTRRQLIQAGVAAGAALSGGAASAGPAKEELVSFVGLLLPERLKKGDIQAAKGGTFSKHEFAGSTFWVKIVDLSDGVPHTAVGVYAPDKEGALHRCLAAESWPAGIIEASVDKESGLLEVRERAGGKLKGQLVLACNLRTVGTQHSIREK